MKRLFIADADPAAERKSAFFYFRRGIARSPANSTYERGFRERNPKEIDMGRLTYSEFVRYLRENMPAAMGPDYAGAEVTAGPVAKLGSTYKGLAVRLPGQKAAVTINLDDLYGDYRNGKAVEAILREAAETAAKVPAQEDIGWVENLAEVRPHLFVRLSNAVINHDLLQKVPHRRITDLALTAHVEISMSGRNEVLCSTMVNNSLLGMYGIKADELIDMALENSVSRMPALIERTDCFMQRWNLSESGNGTTELMTVTNRQMINGAAVLFYPGVLDTLGRTLGDYYVIPSSIHEVLALPEGYADYEGLTGLVRRVNAVAVSPQEKLSDHLYHYDCAAEIFETADDYRRRCGMENREGELKV